MFLRPSSPATGCSMTADSENAPKPPASSGKTSSVPLDETISFPQDTPSTPAAPPSGNAAADAWIGKTLGKYQITGFLGHGGMGIVLKGRDPMIERDVAIKLLAAHLAKDEVSLNRFL